MKKGEGKGNTTANQKKSPEKKTGTRQIPQKIHAGTSQLNKQTNE